MPASELGLAFLFLLVVLTNYCAPVIMSESNDSNVKVKFYAQFIRE